MDGYSLLVVVFVFELCKIVSSEFRLNGGQKCLLENNQMGKCISISLCPKSSTPVNSTESACPMGKVCCEISSKIMTPENVYTSSPVQPQNVNNQGASTAPAAPNPIPNGGIPNGSSPPAGSTQSPGTNNTPGGSSPSGPPPGGSSPPSGSTPNGSPPSSAPPAGAPPALVGNIVAAPGLPPKSLPPIDTSDDYDSIVVSAEVPNNDVDIFEQKCKQFSSTAGTVSAIPKVQGSLTPIVMIYGGVPSENQEFPHMAALGYGEPNAKQWLCGGSLISENFVITAAHCLSTRQLGNVRYVKLGNLKLDEDAQNTQLRNVISATPHEQYNSVTQYNDIALLQLNQPIQISNYVTPICILSSSNYEDRNLVATGWGKTESQARSLNLQKVGLEIFTHEECRNAYAGVSSQQLPLGIQESIQVCAGSHSQSKDTCQGDSGGPLQIRKNNRWYLVGITSVGLKCGVANVPGVYTRVSAYLQWIQDHVWNK